MANRNYPLSKETLDFVRAIPALAMTSVRKEEDGRFTAFLDIGPKTYVADASPMGRGGATPQEACEAMRAWLLDDLACEGRLGKKQYQPHWDDYDIRYRLGKHWETMQQLLPSIEAGLELLQAPPRKSALLPPGYEGWTNSATYLVNLYTAQEPLLHARVVALFKSGKLTADQLKRVAPVVTNRSGSDACGYFDGKLRLDEWAEGAIDWGELTENWKSELTPSTPKEEVARG